MHLELTTFRGEGDGGGGLEGGGEKIHAGLRAISLCQVSPNGEGRTIRAPPTGDEWFGQEGGRAGLDTAGLTGRHPPQDRSVCLSVCACVCV